MPNIPTGAIRKAPSLLGKLFRLKIASIFVFFILINVVIISIQAKDITPGIKDLGDRFITPTLKWQDVSKDVVEKGGFYVEETGQLYKDLWNSLVAYGEFFSQMWVVLLWLFALAWIVGKSPISTSVDSFKNYFVAVVLFFIIQFFYILLFAEQISLMSPLSAFRDVGKAIPYTIQPFVNIANKLFS